MREPPAPSATTSARAPTEGSEVTMRSARLATSRGLFAATPPARWCSAHRRGTTSKPATRNPARPRLNDIAEPMMPRPTIPTVCCVIIASSAAPCCSLQFEYDTHAEVDLLDSCFDGDLGAIAGRVAP